MYLHFFSIFIKSDNSGSTEYLDNYTWSKNNSSVHTLNDLIPLRFVTLSRTFNDKLSSYYRLQNN